MVIVPVYDGASYSTPSAIATPPAIAVSAIGSVAGVIPGARVRAVARTDLKTDSIAMPFVVGPAIPIVESANLIHTRVVIYRLHFCRLFAGILPVCDSHRNLHTLTRSEMERLIIVELIINERLQSFRKKKLHIFSRDEPAISQCHIKHKRLARHKIFCRHKRRH